MRYLILFHLFAFPFALLAQTGLPEIDEAIRTGHFGQAQQQIASYIAQAHPEPLAAVALELQSALLDRIKLDFNRDEAYVRKTLQPYFPELSAEQLQQWEESGVLEMRIIEGEKRYFRNAVWNLLRVDSLAKARKLAIDGPGDKGLDHFLSSYLPGAVEAVQARATATVRPKEIKVAYTLTVKPDAVPDGEVVRAWLPYPRTSRSRLGSVKLHKVSEPHYVLSPMGYPHSSIYMEKAAKAGEPTVFSYRLTYTAYDEWHDLLSLKAEPYDTTSRLFREFTAEREQHIRFTPEIKALADDIIGGAEEPVLKAWLIYQWIGQNIPWASALEYSTMPNIPAYCLENRRGDCGMKALLFITLCRYAGIPAKWQSGWFLYPGHKNLHDWAELYFEGIGWVPVDPDFNIQDIPGSPFASRFFFGGADAYRFIVNDDFSGPFFPAKVYPRSETVDFQRGEVEWKGGNLYFNQWWYNMEVTHPEP
ncbi:transglutaminase-like domain-containing protein [Phaeodactylibacter luteus]|uniref:Transglutaminase domain-containing protein n=1 Tax=Phaeodactylibacter luteus TaxID=1564516 RepID=A0A5C6S0R7_9BACT|nr:transglutaminase-like domain-containing protein [Phaeodactylibacter luteus]TXB67589.1 transglutaminase domain-containing protein [Phaeodactylibacter luteus]